MHLGMRNLRKLKVIHYASRLIDPNEYLVALPGSKAGDKIVKVCQMYGVRNIMYRFFTVKLSLFLKMSTYLNAWKFKKLFMKVL